MLAYQAPVRTWRTRQYKPVLVAIVPYTQDPLAVVFCATQTIDRLIESTQVAA